MNPRELFNLYRSEHHNRPIPGFTLEVFPHLSRHTAQSAGAQGMVMFAQLDPARTGEQIDEQVRYFSGRGEAFEWTSCDFDTPHNLKALLEERGFVAEDVEAFLVFPLADWSTLPSETVEIKKITNERDLVEYVATEQAIWSKPFPLHFARYALQLRTAPDEGSMYCAYVDSKPVATGRISFPAGSNFAGLWGGGVLPAMRGRGLYTAMLSHRIAEAKARGFRWITIDAAPMSRPILLKKGFTHVCWTYPMIHAAPAD